MTSILAPSLVPYNPTNFFPANATRKFWCDFNDTTKLTKSGGGTPANGDSVQAAADKISGTSIWTNTGAGKPVFRTGLSNGFGGLQFTAQSFSGVTLDYIKNTSVITFAAVIASIGAPVVGGLRVLAAGNASGSQLRFDAGFVTGALRLVLARTDAESQVITDASVKQLADTYSAGIWEWNPATELMSIYWNNYATNKVNVDLSGSLSLGLIPNTNSNFITLGDSSGDNAILDTFLFADAPMTPYLRSEYFKAVKSRFALTVY